MNDASHPQFRKRLRGSRNRAKPSKSDHRRQLPAEIKAFTNRIVDRIELQPLDCLKSHLRKTRVHNERLIGALMGSFNQFGYLIPIVIDEKGVVLAGDARVEAARRLGITHLPCVEVNHLSEDDKRAFKIADNRLAELAEWDFPELKAELDLLVTIDFNLDAISFTTPEIDLIGQQAEAAKPAKPDEADRLPEAAPGPAVTEPGDIWQLGKHRIICGSALDPAVLEALMDGRTARMVLTDAPYNVAVQGFVSGLGKARHREFAMASGEMSKEKFLEFLTKASALACEYLIDGGLFYGFMDWRGAGVYMSALDACGLSQINLCIWNKGTGGMGTLYRSQHELCLVYKKGSAPHLNNVQLGSNGRYRTNVWDHPGMASFGRGRDEALAMHPTVKPVNLLVEAIKDVTEVNDIVIDTFLGSGSTLIAAHKCGRVCHGVEIDPLYADTIVRRFEAFAGIEAVHAVTGKTFAEMAKMRQAQAQAVPAEDPDPPPVTIHKRSRAGMVQQVEAADE